MQDAEDGRQQHCHGDKVTCNNSTLVPLHDFFKQVHVGVKMHSDRHGKRDMGWKDTRDVCPISHAFLQGQSPVSETSISNTFETKTAVRKDAVASRPHGSLLAKSWKREKSSCASCVPAEPQASS